jgi:2-dehydro-3-deoxyphosphogluconate aldolase/(4S)-4-hydroxy-2-oxoglutarate aldolase
MTEILSRLGALKLIPVIVIDDAETALPLAEALLEGGLPCAEITLRTAAAADALRRIAESFPELLVGAGTVLTPGDAASARDAGARFVVSPGLNPEVVAWCQGAGVPIYPGACTPTEIEVALRHGLRVVKFFPAEAMGGSAFLKAISAPYGEMRFIPTGGVTAANLAEYLSLPQVIAVGGSWMVSREWIRDREFARIRQEVAGAVRLVSELGGWG